VRTIASGALGLAHRALETHARNVGYQKGAWVDRALEQAGAWLCFQVDIDVPVLLDHARGAAIALTRATAATADDRMLVPDELAAPHAPTRQRDVLPMRHRCEIRTTHAAAPVSVGGL
jgi:hypothetical protein